MPVSEA